MNERVFEAGADDDFMIARDQRAYILLIITLDRISLDKFKIGDCDSFIFFSLALLCMHVDERFNHQDSYREFDFFYLRTRDGVSRPTLSRPFGIEVHLFYLIHTHFLRDSSDSRIMGTISLSPFWLVNNSEPDRFTSRYETPDIAKQALTAQTPLSSQNPLSEYHLKSQQHLLGLSNTIPSFTSFKVRRHPKI